MWEKQVQLVKNITIEHVSNFQKTETPIVISPDH
jgi:hypothetical protein